MLYNQLQDAGLNENEAKIYLAALELGQATVSRIARKSGIKRTTVYLSLENLLEKGLMSTIKVKGKAHYYAEDPRNLERLMEERRDRVAKLVPQLLAFTNLIDKKPQIRYFEGQMGIKEVFKDTLNYPNREILAWFPRSFESFIDEYYVPKRLEKNIWVRAIMPDNEKSRDFSKNEEKQLRKSKLIPEGRFDIDVEITLYGGNKIGIISFDEEMALIIESPKIHNSFKSIFETMWAMAPEIPKV